MSVRDVLAPPFWRDRFGATVLAQDVLAKNRFGAGSFGAHIPKSISIKIILHFNVYDTIYIYIRTIVESYRERNIIEFLRGIAHNFLMEP